MTGRQKLDSDLLDYLLQDTTATRDFLCWLEDDIKSGGPCARLVYALDHWAHYNKTGVRWYEKTLEGLIHEM